jgi:hypothetical protein
MCRMPRYRNRPFELPLEFHSGLRDTGPERSEILHDTPPGPPESHYLLSSPEKPVPAECSARMTSFFREQRTLVSRSLHALPSHRYLYQGGPCTLRERGNSDTTDKLGGWQDSPAQRWFQSVFCDRLRLRMSIAARARIVQAEDPNDLRITGAATAVYR